MDSTCGFKFSNFWLILHSEVWGGKVRSFHNGLLSNREPLIYRRSNGVYTAGSVLLQVDEIFLTVLATSSSAAIAPETFDWQIDCFRFHSIAANLTQFLAASAEHS